MTRSYGDLLLKAYDYWFGKGFERPRMRILGVLQEVAGGYRGSLREDRTTDLFPLLSVERPRWTTTVRLGPSFRGRDGFQVVVQARSREIDPGSNPLPVVNCLSANLLGRDLGAPWLERVGSSGSTFDARFLTRVLPGSGAQAILTPRIRARILDLYFRSPARPNLWFESQADFVRLKHQLSADAVDARVLRDWTRGAVFLLAALVRPRLAAARPLPDQRVERRLESALCRVCGEVVLDRAVACAACDTTHHQECFAYTGRCAIYACASPRSVPLSAPG